MKLKITVDGKEYEVEVEVADQEPTGAVRYVASPRAPGSAPLPSVGSAGTAGPEPVAHEGLVCRSPLAGVVSEVKVAAGDTVDAEQPLLVLEAMKMFTTITSPQAGTILSLPVKPGDAVKQGQVLVEFAQQ